MIGRWINGKLRWYGRAADALSGLLSDARKGVKIGKAASTRHQIYRGGNDAILVDRQGRATTGSQRRKVVLEGRHK